jgi:hypothetical protein
MPYRTLATLQSWVDEFALRGDSGLGSIRAIPQDGSGGADTGLVAVQLPNSPTVIYLEPPARGSGRPWSITFEPREQCVTLAADAIAKMADELGALAALCVFLQEKSETFLSEHSSESAGLVGSQHPSP